MRTGTLARRGSRLLAVLAVALLAASPALAQDGDEPDIDIGDVGLDDEPPEPDDGGIDIGMEPAPDGAGDPAPDAPPEPEPVVRDPKLAKKLARGAAKFRRAGDRYAKRKKDAEAAAEWERALAAYLKSFELHPDPKMLVAAAELQGKLGRWIEAARLYERALAEQEIPLDAKSQDKTYTALDAAMMNFGVVKVIVSPEGAAVTLDGQAVGEAPLGKPLWLNPGEYTLAIAHDGFVPQEVKLVVEAGSESERTFELEPVPVVVAPPRPPPPPPPPPLPPAPKKTAVWIGAGATGAFVVGAVVTGVIAIGKHGTFTDETATPEARESAQSSGKTMALLSDVFTAGAVISGAFTAYYYLKVYKPKASEHERLERERGEVRDEYARRRHDGPKVVVTPVVQADGGGLVLSGWF